MYEYVYSINFMALLKDFIEESTSVNYVQLKRVYLTQSNLSSTC